MGTIAQQVMSGALATGRVTGDRAAATAFASGQPYVPPGITAAAAPRPGTTVTVPALVPDPARKSQLAAAGADPSGFKTLLGQ